MEPKQKAWNPSDAKTQATKRFIYLLQSEDYAAIQRLILEGSINGYMRYKLWMQVLNVDKTRYAQLMDRMAVAMDYVNSNDLRKQMELDVARAFHYERKHYEPTEFNFAKHGRRLLLIMSSVLGADHSWQYFQGLHEVCTVLLRCLGLRGSMLAAVTLTRRYFLPLMKGALIDQQLLEGLHDFTKQILRHTSASTYELVRQPGWRFSFQVPWIMTWMANHSFKVEQIYDLLLLRPPIFICYLSASLINQVMPLLDYRDSEPCELEAQIKRQAELLDSDHIRLIMRRAVEMEIEAPPSLIYQQPRFAHLQATVYGQLTGFPIPATASTPLIRLPTLLMLLVVLAARFLQPRD